jgi:hypothetical protein
MNAILFHVRIQQNTRQRVREYLAAAYVNP